jgi:hypothetical protein
MRLGHASVPLWWEASFKSITEKLPTGKVPMHNLSKILSSAVRLNVPLPPALMQELSQIIQGERAPEDEEDEDEDFQNVTRIVNKFKSS